MKVAVTGAAGFVGLNLVEQLLNLGHEVIAIDRQRPSATAISEHPRLTWKQGNILDAESMRTVLAGSEIVYHLVALITLRQHDDLAWRINTEGVRTVAEAAVSVGVRRMVHCSSIHSFDQFNCGSMMSESSPRSIDPKLPVYDRSKYAGEVALRKVIDTGLDAVICNPTGIYGPKDFGLSRINALLRDSARGRIPALIKGGFDLVDVRDVASGLILAGEKGTSGENYLLSGTFSPMFDVFKFAAQSVGRRGPLVAFPIGAIKAVLPILEPIGRAMGSDKLSRNAIAALEAQPQIDSNKARTQIDYVSRPTEETIKDLISFLTQSGQL